MRIAALFLLLSFFSGAAFPADEIQIQMLAARLESLRSERGRKADELRACERDVKGFKVAGIATLSATGVGIGINIALASKLAGGKSGGATGGHGRVGAAADNITREETDQRNARLLAKIKSQTN